MIHTLRTRRTVALLCFLAVAIGYTDRVNMAVASIAMREQFHWTQTTKGLVLSSFFLGYMGLMALSGWLATRIGGARVLVMGVLLWSFFTLVTPFASLHSLAWLVATRIGMGAGESALFPACYELLAHLSPETERSRSVTWILSGIPVGTILGLSVSGWLTGHWGWQSSFYLFGIIGLAWCAIWWGYARDFRQVADPKKGPNSGQQSLTLRDLFASRPVVALFLGHFSANWLLFFFLSWLPSYFRDGLGLTIGNAGLFSAAPWIALAISSNVAGYWADMLLKRGRDVTRVRKLMQSVGLVAPAACLLLLPHVATAEQALGLVCISMAGLGCCWAGYAVNAIELAPRQSGFIMGVSNTVGTIPGVFGVGISGWLLDVTGTFAAAFYLTALISVVGAIVFGLFASSRPIQA